MTTSDFITPLASTGDQGDLREALITRVPYTFTATENTQDYVAVDSGTGAISWALVWAGRLFFFDPDDNTSAHDGLTVIVTSDGYRYKTDGIAGDILSVKTRTLTSPPSTPAIGDAYLVPAGSTGDWATHPNNIAVWTARGWSYIPPQVGQIIFVEDEAGLYHYGTGGAWVAGVGSSALGAGTVRASSLIGGRTHWVIVNQTTNAPPVSPANGVAYIVGPSPTGAWAGQTAKIAVWEVNAWTFYSPLEGWTAYDQAMNVSYVFNGAWNSQQSGYSSVRVLSATGSATVTGAGTGSAGTASSATVPPASNGPRVEETIGSPISIQADYAGQVFEVTYLIHSGSAQFTASSGSIYTLAFGLFLDSETQARDWFPIATVTATGGSVSSPVPETSYTFSFAVADTSAHQLRLMFAYGRVSGTGTPSAVGGTFARRRVIIRKLA